MKGKITALLLLCVLCLAVLIPVQPVSAAPAAAADLRLNLQAGLLNTYFSESLLIGDSVMTGYEFYCRSHEAGPVSEAKFLASGSLSAHNALWTISSASVHPVYMGEKRYLWDSIRMIAPKRAFFFLGLNDMNMGSDSVERYKELIDRILAETPDLEIHIISTTYTLAGISSGHLNNDNIRAFNTAMQELAAQEGWGFVDLAEPLSDGNGNLLPAYCSDRYVHHTNAAYAVWTQVLTDYALTQITP